MVVAVRMVLEMLEAVVLVAVLILVVKKVNQCMVRLENMVLEKLV
jgi:flagellar biogenesis protein FliO